MEVENHFLHPLTFMHRGLGFSRRVLRKRSPMVMIIYSSLGRHRSCPGEPSIDQHRGPAHTGRKILYGQLDQARPGEIWSPSTIRHRVSGAQMNRNPMKYS